MSAVVLTLPRKKARTLSELACEKAKERRTAELKQALRCSVLLEDMVPEIETAFDESWAALLELGGR